MLVLSRRAGESIRISDDIVISVQRIAGNRIVLGIEAPKEVSIRRGELAIEGAEVEVAAPADGMDADATDSPAAVARPRRRTATGAEARSDAARSTNPRTAGTPAQRGRGVGAAIVSGPLAAWSTANLS